MRLPGCVNVLASFAPVDVPSAAVVGLADFDVMNHGKNRPNFRVIFIRGGRNGVPWYMGTQTASSRVFITHPGLQKAQP